MKTDRRRFRPAGPDTLERRVALTHGGPIVPALIGTLSPNTTASGRSGRVVAQINNAYDRFTADYLQAQGAYLASGAPASTFTTFTAQRVNLLAQELTRTFALLPGSFRRIKNASERANAGGSSVLFQAFLFRTITGSPASSLRSILTSPAVVPPPLTVGGNSTLFTLTATNAIQAARTATINAARFIALGTFNNH
jgi:hypothetical protein